MRTFTRALLCGLFAVSFGFAACDSDDDKPADTTTPDTTTPDTSTPDTSTPDTSTPDTTEPDTSTPDTSTPDTTEPDTSTPDTAQPDTTPTGACTNAADLAIIQAANPDPADVAGQCGLACLGDGDPRACSADCVANGKGNITGTGLTADCSGCYADTIKCAIDNCVAVCLNPDSQECASCRENAGCNDAFYTCSGLPRN